MPLEDGPFEQYLQLPKAEKTYFYADMHFNTALLASGLESKGVVSIFAYQHATARYPEGMTLEGLKSSTLRFIESTKVLPDRWIPMILIDDHLFISPDVESVSFEGAVFNTRDETHLSLLLTAAKKIRQILKEEGAQFIECPECGKTAMNFSDRIACEFCNHMEKL